MSVLLAVSADVVQQDGVALFPRGPVGPLPLLDQVRQAALGLLMAVVGFEFHIRVGEQNAFGFAVLPALRHLRQWRLFFRRR